MSVVPRNSSAAHEPGPAIGWPTHWRFVQSAPADGGWNMASDLALMHRARADNVGIIRVYGWSEPTISFGRNERLVGRLQPDLLEPQQLAVVRRPTGGRALLHDSEITYTVVLPVQQGVAWRTVYDRVNLVLLDALRAAGIPAAAIATHTHPQSGADAVCFSGTAAGEIAVDGRKLVASSVWRENGAYLQHGIILVHDDQYRIASVLAGAPPLAAPAATLSELLDVVPTREIFAEVLARAFAAYGIVDAWSIPESVACEIDVLRQSLLLPSWLWRR